MFHYAEMVIYWIQHRYLATAPGSHGNAGVGCRSSGFWSAYPDRRPTVPLLIFVAAFVLLALASQLWGADSRNTHAVLS
jgi:hypothetical protein